MSQTTARTAAAAATNTRSARRALMNGTLSAVLVFYAAMAGGVLGGGVAAALGWAALGYALVACAYLGGGPALLGKRRDGRLAGGRGGVLLASCVVGAVIVMAMRLVTGCTYGRRFAREMAPGVHLSGLPLPFDRPVLRALGVGRVLDLTAEFPADAHTRGLRYLCLPTLDGMALSRADLDAAVAFLAAGQAAGERTLVHCALGRGRSATVVCAWLLKAGLAATPAEAERRLRGRGAHISLSAEQRALLDAWAAQA